MLPPLPRCSDWASSSLVNPAVSAFPGMAAGSACTSSFSRFAQRSLALRPAHSRRSPIRDPLSEGFSHFVSSMTAPVASGWSDWPGGACTHWKAPPCHGARHERPFGTQTWSPFRGIGSRSIEINAAHRPGFLPPWSLSREPPQTPNRVPAHNSLFGCLLASPVATVPGGVLPRPQAL
jgi:hypothetical protein